MKCPSCQFEQPDERLDCECCGLIFAKWKARHEPQPPAAEVAPAPKASPKPIPEAVKFGEDRDRFYHRLAAMEFQRAPTGEVIYFPWGSMGRGFQGLDETAQIKLHRFESLFSCVQCPALVLLWMIALLLWLYAPASDYRGAFLFILYLAGSYLGFWWLTRRNTAGLAPSSHRYDSIQYLKTFARIFYWKVWLSPEVISLFLLSADLWLWFSRRMPFYFANYQAVQWIWLILSGAVLGGSSYFFYFKSKK